MSPERPIADIYADLEVARLDAEGKRQHAGLGKLKGANEARIRKIDQYKVAFAGNTTRIDRSGYPRSSGS